MLITSLILSLIAVIAFAADEYFTNKATYNFKTAWYKYAVGLIAGTFGFPYLLKWGYFQDVLLACFVFVSIFLLKKLFKH